MGDDKVATVPSPLTEDSIRQLIQEEFCVALRPSADMTHSGKSLFRLSGRVFPLCGTL